MLPTINEMPYNPAELTRTAQGLSLPKVMPTVEHTVNTDDALVLLNALSLHLLPFEKGVVVPESTQLQQIADLIRLQQRESMETLPGMINAMDAIVDANLATEQGDNDIALLKALLEARCHVTAANLDKVNNILRDSKLRAKATLSTFSSSVANAPFDNVQARSTIPESDSVNAGNERNTADVDEPVISTRTSYAELWERIAVAVGNINKDYVEFYADLMQKYTKMYEIYNNFVQKAASEAVNSASDANNVKFNQSKMRMAYHSFSIEVSNLSLGEVKGWGELTTEQRDKMKLSLKPAFQINDDGKIEFDLKQFDELRKNEFTSQHIEKDVLTTRYQAWLASFNAVGNALQSNMQSFSQSYGQSNNTFANLNKILSGVINSLGDSAKDVFKSLS